MQFFRRAVAAAVGGLLSTGHFSTFAMAGGSRSIKHLFHASQLKEGGGFWVRRSVGSREMSVLDPFLMLDHLGPTKYGPGEAVGAPDHPHRGFETVTYVLEGGFQHKDSQGNEGNLLPGWVQWMTAGSGVIHSEMPSDDLMKNGGTMHGFQLWVNLPKEKKMTRPRYQDVPPEKIPKAKTEDGRVEVVVIAGESLGKSAVIDTHIPITMLDVRISAGGSLIQPIQADHNSFVYVYGGKGQLGGKDAKLGDWVVLDHDGDSFTISCPEDGEAIRVLLFAGKPINEPVARYGPFVMNTQEELRQAFKDYQSGTFGEIEGADERYEQTAKANIKRGDKDEL